MAKTGPVAVCRTSDLTEAGAFWTQDADAIPLLVTRDVQGSLHAFVNHCRHRGVRLVNEKHGVTKSFTCLLHGWTYGLDGAMGGAPLAKLAQTNPLLATIRENNALTPLPFEIRHGFVWVAPRARDGLDLAAYLGAADAALAARDVTHFTVRERSEEKIPTPDLRAVVKAAAGAAAHIHELSEDAAIVFHATEVSLFTLVRREAEMDFGMHIPAIYKVEHVLLTPPPTA